MDYQSYVRYAKAQIAARDRRIKIPEDNTVAGAREVIDDLQDKNNSLRSTSDIEDNTSIDTLGAMVVRALEGNLQTMRNQIVEKDNRIKILEDTVARMQEAVDHMVTENACLQEAPHIERNRLNAGWKAANEAKLEAHQENDRLLRKIMEQEKQIIFMKTYIDFVHKTT